jgi:phenylpropionate dioxygenase-like ring-hydroxylating dioxygenase large terminal subunit
VAAYPSAWYPFGLAADFEPGCVVPARAFGTSWSVFRAASGQPAIVHSTCCHMGADLSRGTVVEGRLRCSLHAWEFGRDGVCACIPGVGRIPPNARQPALPAVEKYGLVWGYLGQGEPPELPAPDGFGDSFFLSRPFASTLDLAYPMIGANAFDTHHLLPLHNRALLEPPEITTLSPRCIRLRYRAGVVGTGAYDRITRALGVREVDVETDCWDGTQLLFHHRRMHAFTLFAARPLDEATTRVYLRTGRARRFASPLLRPLDQAMLDLHQRLLLVFVFQDLDALRGLHLEPGVLLAEQDRSFIAWHRHFSHVPRVAVPN